MQILLVTLFKNACGVLFSPVTEGFDCHNFSYIMESVLAITSSNALRTLGHVCSFPMDVCRFRFLLNGRDLVCPVPALRPRDLRDAGREIVSENSPASPCWLPLDFLTYLFGSGWVYFLNSSFSDQCSRRSPSHGSSNSVTNSKLQMCLIFPDAVPTHASNTPIFFPGLISLLYFSSTRRS